MGLSTKTVVILSILLVSTGYAAGRYIAPEKVVTKIETKVEIKEIIKWKTNLSKDEKKDKEIVIIETIMPDGTIKREKRIIDKGTIKLDLSKQSEKDSSTTKSEKKQEIKIKNSPDWKLSGMVLVSPKSQIIDSGLTYGLLIERRIIGPFYLGAFAINNGAIGASIGVTF
jgi:hypothetical protein